MSSNVASKYTFPSGLDKGKLVVEQVGIPLDMLLCMAWEAPPVGIIKINVNANFMADEGFASIGVVVIDYEGVVLLSPCDFHIAC